VSRCSNGGRRRPRPSTCAGPPPTRGPTTARRCSPRCRPHRPRRSCSPTTTCATSSSAWTLAHNLELTDGRTWADLADAYEKVNPVSVLPVLRRLVLGSLRDADARSYQYAARQLRRMRRIAAGTDHATEVDALIAALREEHRRRPRLQREFDALKLP
jgi:hypothetical protein